MPLSKAPPSPRRNGCSQVPSKTTTVLTAEPTTEVAQELQALSKLQIIQLWVFLPATLGFTVQVAQFSIRRKGIAHFPLLLR